MNTKATIFAAFHGSWNRVKHAGYKVVRLPFDHSTGKAFDRYEDFVTGFHHARRQSLGRPMGITVAKDGRLPVFEVTEIDGQKIIGAKRDTIWSRRNPQSKLSSMPTIPVCGPITATFSTILRQACSRF